jgi:hypothetical protein
VPHIRQILTFSEPLRLVGDHAVLDAGQLGNIQNNPLATQRDYFARLCAADPADETLPFALAQVLREMGSEEEANRRYDQGIATVKRNWCWKSPWFFVPSLAGAAALWQQGFAPWLVGVVGLVGPLLWYRIYGNRLRWIPYVGFSQRAETAGKVDMAGALAGKT